MTTLLYLSTPYSTPDPELRAHRVAMARRQMAMLMGEGRATVCPVAMNHEAMEHLEATGTPGGPHWREVETRLAHSCDELVVLMLPGWKESRGVAREIALFEGLSKPISFIVEPDGGGLPDGRKGPIDPVVHRGGADGT